MSQLRLNPLTGRWVTVAVDRARRPAPGLKEQNDGRETKQPAGPQRAAPGRDRRVHGRVPVARRERRRARRQRRRGLHVHQSARHHVVRGVPELPRRLTCRLTDQHLANALGIAASSSSGLFAFVNGGAEEDRWTATR